MWSKWFHNIAQHNQRFDHFKSVAFTYVNRIEFKLLLLDIDVVAIGSLSMGKTEQTVERDSASMAK
jgi:hypothetical protein